ncbi:tail terminator [Arthrobacter phage Chridison]|nr:tail terminator [Arthrobacter phage Chridison]
MTMNEIIITVDSEDLLLRQVQFDLRTKFNRPGIMASTAVPNPRPPEFVILRRVGGVMRDLVTDEPTILVEAWSSTETKAARLANEVRGLLHWYTEIDGYSILGCDEISGPVNLPDGLSAQVRYTATYVVAIRSGETVTPTEGAIQ